MCLLRKAILLFPIHKCYIINNIITVYNINEQQYNNIFVRYN